MPSLIVTSWCVIRWWLIIFRSSYSQPSKPCLDVNVICRVTCHLIFCFAFCCFFFFLSQNCTLKAVMTGLRCTVLKVHFAKSFHRKAKSQGLNHRMKKHKAYGNLHCIVLLYSIKIKTLLKHGNHLFKPH